MAKSDTSSKNPITEIGEKRELSKNKVAKSVVKMNKKMEEVRRDYNAKAKQSKIDASKVVLTS